MNPGGSAFLPQEIIRAKRDGNRLSDAEISQFVAGLTDGSVGDGQAAALAMAVFFKGMDIAERTALDSGDVAIRRHHAMGSSPPARSGHRQAFDGRSGRQGQLDACTTGRRLRRSRAHDLRPWPRAHGRNARQAREHPRLPRPARQRTVPQGRRRGGVCDHRADIEPSAGRWAPLCDPRCHRHGGIDPADHRLDPLQEARCRS